MKTLFTIIIIWVILAFPREGDGKMDGKDLINSFFSERAEIDCFKANDFVGSFTMNVIKYKRGKPTKDSPMKIDFYFKDNKVAFVPGYSRGQNAIMIYDLKEKVMTTLIDQDGEKTGIKMKIPQIKLDAEDAGKLDFTIKPTDEKKTIEGHLCRKYLTESEENSGYVWVTEEVNLDYSKIFNFLNLEQKSANTSMPGLQDLKGFAMEAYSESKKKDESYEMKITNLIIGKVNGQIFDTSDYTITDMSSLMDFGVGE